MDISFHARKLQTCVNTDSKKHSAVSASPCPSPVPPHFCRHLIAEPRPFTELWLSFEKLIHRCTQDRVSVSFAITSAPAHTFRFPTYSTASQGNNYSFLKGTYQQEEQKLLLDSNAHQKPVHPKIMPRCTTVKGEMEFTPPPFIYLAGLQPCKCHNAECSVYLAKGKLQWGEREEEWTRLGVSW